MAAVPELSFRFQPLTRPAGSSVERRRQVVSAAVILDQGQRLVRISRQGNPDESFNRTSVIVFLVRLGIAQIVSDSEAIIKIDALLEQTNSPEKIREIKGSLSFFGFEARAALPAKPVVHGLSPEQDNLVQAIIGRLTNDKVFENIIDDSVPRPVDVGGATLTRDAAATRPFSTATGAAVQIYIQPGACQRPADLRATAANPLVVDKAPPTAAPPAPSVILNPENGAEIDVELVAAIRCQDSSRFLKRVAELTRPKLTGLARPLWSRRSPNLANLAGVTFNNLDFSGWNFSKTNLTMAVFSNCRLVGTIFEGAITTGICFNNCTRQ